MAEHIDLTYPPYLDVPLITSFVAALEEGIAYGADVAQKKDQQLRIVSAEGAGKAGAGLLLWAFIERCSTSISEASS